jgi:hypothetical protein
MLPVELQVVLRLVLDMTTLTLEVTNLYENDVHIVKQFCSCKNTPLGERFATSPCSVQCAVMLNIVRKGGVVHACIHPEFN